jgi:Asp-tRNA(Asn)/Glu-tRNA(Gln) amidotransferase A subunit family amidase
MTVIERFRDRSLSPLEYLDALIARADAAAPVVNAFGDRYDEDARRLARAAEARYLRGDARPLEGVPVAVKDEAEIAGRRSTNGSLLWVDSRAERTEPMVERIEGAGAVVHARTLTPEFSVTFWTSSRLWGVTRNPWNPAFDVGGSSGGSAAALAAGLTPLATGSDIGGSIRQPASCCGVVGYKPTYGRVPQPPPYGMDHWCHLGPLARTVADAALLADVVTGPHPLDHASIRPALRLGTVRGEVRGLRVALSLDLGDWPVAEPVRSALSAVADALRQAGAVVEEVPLVVERSLLRTASDAHYAAVFAAATREVVLGREDEVNGYVLHWLRSLDDPPSVLAGLAAEGEITRRIAEVHERYDALLCPAMGISALAAGVDYSELPVEFAGGSWDAMHDLCLTEVFNAAARCPVVCVPAGRDGSGVPIGVQVVGRTFDDVTAFEVARAIERERPWPLVADAWREWS